MKAALLWLNPRLSDRSTSTHDFVSISSYKTHYLVKMINWNVKYFSDEWEVSRWVVCKGNDLQAACQQRPVKHILLQYCLQELQILKLILQCNYRTIKHFLLSQQQDSQAYKKWSYFLRDRTEFKISHLCLLKISSIFVFPNTISWTFFLQVYLQGSSQRFTLFLNSWQFCTTFVFFFCRSSFKNEEPFD